MNTETSLNPNDSQAIDKDPQTQEVYEGRSVFQVQTVAAGVMVSTAFLVKEGQLLQMPAIFPNLEYGLEQIDELRRHVIRHFAQAAQIGAQVIAANAETAAKQTQAGAAGETDSNVSVGAEAVNE